MGQPITFGTGTENVGVIILVSRADIPTPNVGSPSIATTCSQTGVRCYSGGGATSGLALIHGYETGSGPGPIARKVDVGGCDGPPNLSGPYFNLTGDCVVSVTADLDFSGFTNPAGANPPKRLLRGKRHCHEPEREHLDEPRDAAGA